MDVTRLVLCLLSISSCCGVTMSANTNMRDDSVTSRDIADEFSPLSIFYWFHTAVDIIVSYFWPKSTKSKHHTKHHSKGTRGDSKISRHSYLGYQVFRVRPMNEDAIGEIEALEDEPGLQFFSKPGRNKTADILVPPDIATKLRKDLSSNNIEFTVLSHNVDVDMRKQDSNKMTKEQKSDMKESQGHPFSWNRYHRYSDMEDYMDYLVAYAPHIVDVLKIGRSTEGRSLKVVRLSSGKNKYRPAIWIDAGMHGREWVTPSVAMFLLKQLVENYKNFRNLVDNVDWYIMPVANPDGYEFSHFGDRFWRKNRGENKELKDDEYKEDYKEDYKDDDEDDEEEDEESYDKEEGDDYSNDEYREDYKTEEEEEYDESEEKIEDYNPQPRKPHKSNRQKRIFWAGTGRCRGVDLNRNFDYHWGETGSSDDPCDQNYAGPKPFSEPESKAIADFIMERKEQIKAYITMHAYSQMWLVPWGHKTGKPKDYDDLLYLARRAVEALEKVHGTRYRIGPASKLMHPTSGSSEDWAKGKAGIKYSYSIELRDQGTFGFLLPPSQILPTGKETFAAIRVIAKAIAGGLT